MFTKGKKSINAIVAKASPPTLFLNLMFNSANAYWTLARADLWNRHWK